MATVDPLRRVNLLYHFTDRRNLPSIRQQGGLYPLTELRKRNIAIPASGGNQWSHDADAMSGVDEYVHLCFRNNHPMEYVARQDGRITDTIFLQIHPQVLHWEGVRFTSDVANKSGVALCTVEEAKALIDFDVLYTWTDWKAPADRQRLTQAEKCEVLVPHRIPLELIRNFPDG